MEHLPLHVQAKPSAPAAVAAPVPAGDITEAEIVEFMRKAGPIPPTQLSAQFRRRIKTQEQKAAFTAMCKKLVKYSDQEVEGKKYIVLR